MDNNHNYKFNWSEPTPPNDKIPYDHVQTNSPLGKITIEWKSWKENPSYDIESEVHGWIGCEYSLHDAKLKVETWMNNICDEITKIIK